MKLSQQDKEALYLVKCLLEDITTVYKINQLVRKSGLNADKLKKGFKYLYGVPVHRYCIDFKMNAAKELLSKTEFNIDAIAEELGYNDANNFSAAFKKHTGKRPGEWRARRQTQD